MVEVVSVVLPAARLPADTDKLLVLDAAKLPEETAKLPADTDKLLVLDAAKLPAETARLPADTAIVSETVTVLAPPVAPTA